MMEINYKARVVSIWVAAVLFFPYFPGFLPKYFGSDLAFVFSASLPLLYFFTGKISIPRRVSRRVFFLYLFFSISLLVATLRDAQNFHAASFGQLIEIIRPLVIYLIFMFWASIFYNNENDHVALWYTNFYLWLAILISFLCFAEVYGGELIKSFMYFVYKRDYKEIISDKATGVFGITYYLTFFLMFPFVYSLINFFLSFRVKYLLCSCVLMAAAFISQSRTAFFVYIGIVFISLVLVGFFSGRRGKIAAVLFVPIVVVCFSYMYLNIDDIMDNFPYLKSGIDFVLNKNIDLSGGGEGSANIRVSQIYYVIDHLQGGGLIGSGLAKDGDVLLESVYALYIFRYGFIGLIIFFGILIACVMRSFSMARKSNKLKDIKHLSLYLSLVCYFVVVPVALFSSAIQDGAKTSLFYYALVALCLLYYPRLKGSKIG